MHCLQQHRPNIRFVLRACLVKEMKRRFHSAADLRILLEEVPDASEAATSVKQRRPWLAWGAAALFLLTTFILGRFSLPRRAPRSGRACEIADDASDEVTLTPWTSFALSPDGRHLAWLQSIKMGLHVCGYAGWIRSKPDRWLALQYHRIPPFVGRQTAVSLPSLPERNSENRHFRRKSQTHGSIELGDGRIME